MNPEAKINARVPNNKYIKIISPNGKFFLEEKNIKGRAIRASFLKVPDDINIVLNPSFTTYTSFTNIKVNKRSVTRR